jgi:autotransporter-associated beta strand protein
MIRAPRRGLVIAAACVAMVAGFAGRSTALDVIGYSSAANDRFSSGYPTSPVTNTGTAFVGRNYSWTGVGWSSADPTKSFGFLTPQHYLVARHYGGAATINLLGGDGLVYSATQSSVTETGYGFIFSGSVGDISIGRLTTPVAATKGMTRYGVLDLNATSTTNSTYVGQPLLVYGRGPNGTFSTRIGAATINGTNLTGSSSFIVTDHSSSIVQSGDSGSPDFIPWTNPNGGAEITIVGLNSGTASNLTVMSYFANAPAMAAVNAQLTADGFALKAVGNASGTWSGVASTSIGGTAGWGGAVPSDVYVLFNGTTAGGGRAVNVNTAANLRGLYFKDTGSGTAGLTFSGDSTLTVGRGGVTNYDGSRQTISAPITLGDHQYWDVGTGGVTVGNVNTGGHVLEIAGSGTARITGVVSGTGGIALSGQRLELSGSSSYTGRTWVHNGTLVVNGTIASTSGVTVDAGAAVGGSGVVAAISGAGSVGPGNSPGILTAPSVNPSSGLDFNFEFTQTGAPNWATGTASGNDVLRLTSGTAPFAASLTSANVMNVFLDVTSLTAWSVFQGGFFTDRDLAFLGSIQNATRNYYLLAAGGTTSYGGNAYNLYSGPFTFDLATVATTATFAGSSEAGYVTQFTAVPEPSGLIVAIMLVGGGWAARQRRRVSLARS